MLEQLKDRIRDRDISFGVIMIVSGILVWFGLAKFVGLGLVVYGLVQVIWKKEEKLEEHHHHHHHNKKQTTTKKTGKMKKNYQRT